MDTVFRFDVGLENICLAWGRASLRGATTSIEKCKVRYQPGMIDCVAYGTFAAPGNKDHGRYERNIRLRCVAMRWNVQIDRITLF